MRSVVEELGWDVSIAPFRGLGSLAERIEPACVFLDGEGPTGYGRSRETAAELTRSGVPVVMFTGHATEAEEARRGMSARARAAGFTAVLQKPFGLNDLTGALRAVAAARAAQ